MKLVDVLRLIEKLRFELTEFECAEEVCPNCGATVQMSGLSICEGCDENAVCWQCERTGPDETLCSKCEKGEWTDAPKEPDVPTVAESEKDPF